MKRRNIAESHLLSLSLSVEETISRDEYDQTLRISVLKKLENLRPETRITAIVLVYGVPLKIVPEPLDSENEELINRNQNESNSIETSGDVSKLDTEQENKDLAEKKPALMNTNERASVDSELSLVKAGEYELGGWQKNPYFLGFQGMALTITKDQTLLVSRLDGPDKETVIRVIDDTLDAEKNELQGKAYFDARWPPPDTRKGLSGYRLYDASLHRAAELAGKRMEVIINDDEELFRVNCCPSAAIYCGWYSLGNYIDSFDWQMGAIGYHIASSECSYLARQDKFSLVPENVGERCIGNYWPSLRTVCSGFSSSGDFLFSPARWLYESW